MRKTILAVILIGGVWIGLLVWPVQALYALARAVEAGDVDALAARVDFRAVRGSITQQVVDAYLRLTGTKISPLARGLATSGSFADPVIARYVTPQAFIDLLRTGGSNVMTGERPAGMVGLSTETIGSVWNVFASSEYGFRRYEIAVPPSLAPEQQFGFGFRLNGWTWRLTSVRLPERVQVQLVEELKKSLQKSPQ